MSESINLAQKLETLSERYRPRTVGQFNGHDLMVVKSSVKLGPGELYVVPEGVEHCPVAEEEAHVLLIEQQGTPNTGSAATAAARVVI